jgi:hypothetical protein
MQKDHKEEVDGLKQQIDGLKAEMVDLGKNISRLVTEAIDQTRKEMRAEARKSAHALIDTMFPQ